MSQRTLDLETELAALRLKQRQIKESSLFNASNKAIFFSQAANTVQKAQNTETGNFIYSSSIEQQQRLLERKLEKRKQLNQQMELMIQNEQKLSELQNSYSEKQQQLQLRTDRKATNTSKQQKQKIEDTNMSISDLNVANNQSQLNTNNQQVNASQSTPQSNNAKQDQVILIQSKIEELESSQKEISDKIQKLAKYEQITEKDNLENTIRQLVKQQEQQLSNILEEKIKQQVLEISQQVLSQKPDIANKLSKKTDNGKISKKSGKKKAKDRSSSESSLEGEIKKKSVPNINLDSIRTKTQQSPQSSSSSSVLLRTNRKEKPKTVQNSVKQIKSSNSTIETRTVGDLLINKPVQVTDTQQLEQLKQQVHLAKFGGLKLTQLNNIEIQKVKSFDVQYELD